jgi:hypothetical protein
MPDSDTTSTSFANKASAVLPARASIIAQPLQSVAAIALCVALAGCVSNTRPEPPAARTPDDPAVRAAGLQIAGRTFFAGSEGSLRGSIYFGPNREAIQVAPERGVQRLRWGILKQAEGLKGPAVCLFGGYRDISPAGSAVAVEQNGRTAICTPVSTFVRIRSSQGNPLGLGTIIQ